MVTAAAPTAQATAPRRGSPLPRLQPRAEQKPFVPRGAALKLLLAKEPEILISGPAGTGKSRACLEKLYICAANYPRMRALMARKTRESLTQSTMVTLENHVLPDKARVHFHTTDQEYRFPNGSIIALGGLDKPSKLMSTEFDIIYVPEATELTQNDWESLSTRLRNGVMPYQQLIGDCNPDSDLHWLYERCNHGATRMIESRHEDNPTVNDAYLAKLDALTGVRKKRLRFGLWVAAEGQVYEEYDPALHLVDRFDIPAEWPRYWSVDFGFVNPFVWQAYAQDGDGRLWRYREIYMTGRLVEDHARDILRATEGEPRPRAIVCDHDAEGRGTLERHLGMGTTPAKKGISEGIQAMQARLRRREGDDKRPGLVFMRDSLVERDPVLLDKRLPTCTEEEMPGYVWDTRGGRRKGEAPVDKDNHGADATRYACMYFSQGSVGVFF